jgi:MFS-type transporter involved in bile tolerance (Atg22 family)
MSQAVPHPSTPILTIADTPAASPLLVSTTTCFFWFQRAGMASLTVLMVIDSILLLKVHEVQSTVAKP